MTSLPGWPGGTTGVPVPTAPSVPPGWYADPWAPQQSRWWDGLQWTPATQATAPLSARQRAGVPARVLGPGSAIVFTVTGAVGLLLILLSIGPGAFALATLAAVLPLPLYAWAALLLDRLHPEPRAALAWTFAAGATAVVLLALVVNTTAGAVLSAVAGTTAEQVVTPVLVAPVVEESGKAVVLLLLYRRFRHQISGPLDGVVYATMVGLGFATVENILYYGTAVADGTLPGVFVVRGILSPFAHPLFTACFGIGLGLLAAGRTRLGAGAPVLGLLMSIGLHALWNGSTTISGAAVLLMFFAVMVPLFVGMIVLCRKEAAREQRLVRWHLQPEVQAGLLTEVDVHLFSDVGARRRLLQAAQRVHPRAGAAAHELAADLLELANVRDRISNGVFAERYGAPEAALAALTARVARARWALPAPPPSAPWTGLSGAFGLPLPPR